MPPKPRGNSAAGVTQDIPRIGRGERVDFRSDALEQHRPKNEMWHDFGKLWRAIVRAQAEPAMQPEHQWQRAGNQPAVIEMVVEKPGVDVRFDEPAVGGIRRAAGRENIERRHGQSA